MWGASSMLISVARFTQPRRMIEKSDANHCSAIRHQPTAAFPGAWGVNILAKVGMTSKLQMGERSMPPTITQARGCWT